MAQSVPFLDCREKPELEVVRIWMATDGITISRRVCRQCGAHGYTQLKECCISSSEYDRWAWYVHLTPAEVQKPASASGRSRVGSFAGRNGIVRGEEGSLHIQGIPGFIASEQGA